MKTTIKAHMKDVEVRPNAGVSGYVDLALWGEKDQWGVRSYSGVSLSPDQVGALLFGLEQAAEAADIAKERVAA